jgi:hypothetical protein
MLGNARMTDILLCRGLFPSNMLFAGVWLLSADENNTNRGISRSSLVGGPYSRSNLFIPRKRADTVTFFFICIWRVKDVISMVTFSRNELLVPGM